MSYIGLDTSPISTGGGGTGVGGATLTLDTGNSPDASVYIPLSLTSSGAYTDALVTNNLKFNPFTNLLEVPTFTATNKISVGNSLATSVARFPTATAMVNVYTSGGAFNNPFGFVAEQKSLLNDLSSAGILGIGYTNGTSSTVGVYGIGEVINGNDTGNAVGVFGEATTSHTGLNIGLYGNASGGASTNYALFLSAGNIHSSSPISWDLNGTLSFGTNGSIAIQNSSPATSKTTGALTIAGGLGVANSIYTTSVVETKTSPVITGGNVLIDCMVGSLFTVQLTSNITSFSISNIPSSGNFYAFILELVADGTPRTVTWSFQGRTVKWPNGLVPALTSTNGKIDTVAFYTVDNGLTWIGSVLGQNL